MHHGSATPRKTDIFGETRPDAARLYLRAARRRGRGGRTGGGIDGERTRARAGGGLTNEFGGGGTHRCAICCRRQRGGAAVEPREARRTGGDDRGAGTAATNKRTRTNGWTNARTHARTRARARAHTHRAMTQKTGTPKPMMRYAKRKAEIRVDVGCDGLVSVERKLDEIDEYAIPPNTPRKMYLASSWASRTSCAPRVTEPNQQPSYEAPPRPRARRNARASRGLKRMPTGARKPPRARVRFAPRARCADERHVAHRNPVPPPPPPT